jgi:hypothetical protein
MKTLMFRVTVVVIALVSVLGAFTATTLVAQDCTPRAQGNETACFCTNYICGPNYECQGMDCQAGTKKSVGLQCDLVVCTIFLSSCQP